MKANGTLFDYDIFLANWTEYKIWFISSTNKQPTANNQSDAKVEQSFSHYGEIVGARFKDQHVKNMSNDMAKVFKL